MKKFFSYLAAILPIIVIACLQQGCGSNNSETTAQSDKSVTVDGRSQHATNGPTGQASFKLNLKPEQEAKVLQAPIIGFEPTSATLAAMKDTVNKIDVFFYPGDANLEAYPPFIYYFQFAVENGAVNANIIGIETGSYKILVVANGGNISLFEGVTSITILENQIADAVVNLDLRKNISFTVEINDFPGTNFIPFDYTNPNPVFYSVEYAYEGGLQPGHDVNQYGQMFQDNIDGKYRMLFNVNIDTADGTFPTELSYEIVNGITTITQTFPFSIIDIINGVKQYNVYPYPYQTQGVNITLNFPS